MNTKKILLFGLKIVALTIIMFAAFAVGFTISGLSATGGGAEGQETDGGSVAGIFFIVCLVQTVVLSYVIIRSRWYGWKLVGAVFLAMYGLMTIVTQIESIVFLGSQLPEGMVGKIFVMGAVAAGIFSPAAVLVLGKMKRPSEERGLEGRTVMPASEWLWTLGAIGGAYVILYLVFGYFVAWKVEAVREYYGGTDPGNFFSQVMVIWEEAPWMFGLQFFRGLLFAGFALALILTFGGGRLEAAFAAGLLFSVWTVQLLLPNPFMPATVSMVHLVETAPSNFIFGFLAGWLLSRRRKQEPAK